MTCDIEINQDLPFKPHLANSLSIKLFLKSYCNIIESFNQMQSYLLQKVIND